MTLRLVARFDNATPGRDDDRAIVHNWWPRGEVRRRAKYFPRVPGARCAAQWPNRHRRPKGLEAVPSRLGGQSMAVDLAGAEEVTITPPGEDERVECTLVVRQGQSEVCRVSASTSDPGLLKNPGLERDLDDWRIAVYGARPEITFDKSVVREGRQALRVVANEPSDTAIGQDVQLKSGHWYRFSGWVRTRGLNPYGSPVYGTFRIHNAAHNAIAEGANHGADTEWNQVVLKFQAPPGPPPSVVMFFVGFGKGTGTVWFDDLKLVEISGPLDN